MKQTRQIMGMPVTLDVVDASATVEALAQVFAYFEHVDAVFSPYKPDSEVSRIDAGTLALADASDEVRHVYALAEQTRRHTGGFFDIRHGDRIDPSGLVKGWAIFQAAERLRQAGFQNFYVDAGGDVEVAGHSASGAAWRVGIRNPFRPLEVVKVLALSDCGFATSGSYLRGQHIYNPHQPDAPLNEVVSLTVVGPDVYEADRFATAAFAMGRAGIAYIERLDGFEGYSIDSGGRATMTSGFAAHVVPPVAPALVGR